MNIGSLCFVDGEAIRQEGGAGRTVWYGQVRLTRRAPASGKPFGPGKFGPNPSGFGLGRATSPTVAEPLDLGPNSLRQNDSE